jgi:hypothetical protein
VTVRALIGFALSVLSFVRALSAQAVAPAALSSVFPGESSAEEGMVWRAAALSRLLADQDYPRVLLISALGRGSHERGDSAVLSATPVLQALEVDRALSMRAAPADALGVSLSSCREERDAALGTLCSMERLAAIAPPDLARDLTEQGAAFVLAAGAAPFDMDGAWSGDPFQAFAENALAGAWRRSLGHESTDAVVSGLVGLPTDGSVASFQDATPMLRGLMQAYPLGVGDGTALQRDRVEASYRAFLDDAVGSLAGASRGNMGLGDARAEWAAGRSFVYLAAEAAGLSGMERGASDRMRTLGAAAVDLRREAAELPRSLADFGAGLAGAAVSGNVLGIVSRVTSFFQLGGGGMGPEAARDVRALREGLESMRAQMDIRLGGLDQRVTELFGVVDARFSDLELLVATTGRDVRDDLAAVDQGIRALGARLDWMDANTRSYVQAGFDRDYARTLVRCLEHRERNAPPWDDMSFPVFSECLADLRGRAVVDAADALLTDQSTPVDDASLISTLANASASDLAFRLPLLGRVADERFGYPGLAGGRGLANPMEWRLASEAYLTMLADWPDLARAIRPGDLEAMRAVGVEIRSALASIATDWGGGPGAPLFERVLGYYDDRLGALTREGSALALRHRQQTLLAVDPASVLQRVESDDDSAPDLDVPEVVSAEVPTVVRTAAILGVDDTSLVYRLEFEDSVERTNSRHAFLFFGRRHDRFTHTRAVIEVELRSQLHGTIGRFSATGPWVLRRSEEMNGDIGSDEVRKRVEHVADASSHFVASTWPELADDVSAWTVQPVAQPLEVDLEERVESALRARATRGLDNVFASVCAETSRGGLSAADRESALRIRRALEGMSAARVLLESYLWLSSPDAMESSPDLREALFGSEGILDRSRLCAVVAAGASPLRLVWLDEEPRRRAAALRDAVGQAVRATAGRPATVVDATLARIEAAIRVQRLRVQVAAN